VREQRVIDLGVAPRSCSASCWRAPAKLFAGPWLFVQRPTSRGYQRFKEIDGPWAATTRRSLRDLSPRLSTRMARPSPRAAVSLAGVRRHGRLILLLTDGALGRRPAPDPSYLLADARHAVASNAGAACTSSTWDSAHPRPRVASHLRPKAPSCVVDRLSALPEPCAHLRTSRTLG